MPNRIADIGDLHDAILDLTRVTLAVSGTFASRSEAIRKLSELSIPPSRISTILAIPLANVTSALSKARKSAKGEARAESANLDPTGE